jgi:GNAT superfamily N-acetyltransferase
MLHAMGGGTELDVRAIGPEDWPAIERLFGPHGACGGCWCMWARLPRGGELWERSKGETNRRSFRELVRSGRVHALLARAGGEDVGWCCLGPRGDFPRLERVKALEGAWDEGTWGVVCFYVPARWRGRGVASALLAAAIRLARERGARTLEAYPVRAAGGPKASIPAAFAWTGVPALFEARGFQRVSPRGSRERWQLELRRPRRGRATRR